MLNLLIREDRHWLRKEYLLRFTLVFLFFVISMLVIWGVVIGSLYLQIKSEQNIVREELRVVKETSDAKSVENLLSLEKSLNLLVNQLTILNFEQSDLLLEIVSKNQQGINISLISNNLDFKKDNEVFANIEMRGVANTRGDLLSYQTSLSESEMFEKVEIPFSSFAQNSEIPFTVKIETVELNGFFEKQNEESEEMLEAVEDNEILENEE